MYIYILAQDVFPMTHSTTIVEPIWPMCQNIHVCTCISITLIYIYTHVHVYIYIYIQDILVTNHMTYI